MLIKTTVKVDQTKDVIYPIVQQSAEKNWQMSTIQRNAAGAA